MHDIRALGRVPKCVRGTSEAQVQERKLASRLRKARKNGRVSAVEEAELAHLGNAIQLPNRSEKLMEDIRAFGRVPKRVHGRSDADVWERNMELRLRKARKFGLSAAQEAELAELRASEINGLEEAKASPDVLAPFADGAGNRLEQDLLMFSNGIRTRALQRRVQRYLVYVSDPALQSRSEVQKYKELVIICSSAVCRVSGRQGRVPKASSVAYGRRRLPPSPAL